MIISDKRKMYKAYNKGLFGNRIGVYPSLAYLEQAKITHIGIRCALPGHGHLMQRNFPTEQIPNLAADWLSQGVSPQTMVFSEFTPNESLLIQGEIQFYPYTYDLKYSTKKASMPVAMREDPHYLRGLAVKLLLTKYMDSASWQDINDLFAIYPDHVIEFSTFSKNIGIFSHRNTVIWEVRAY